MAHIDPARHYGRNREKDGAEPCGSLVAMSPVRLNAKPDFLIIGAQKAGTTSLSSWLIQHDDVIGPRVKELHFFDRRWHDGNIGTYWADFPLRVHMDAAAHVRGRTVVTGEATPYYLFHPLVPPRVHSVLPEVKLIVVLRDPVERAISHYWHEVKQGRESLSLEDALAAEPDLIAPDLDRVAHGQDPSGLLAAQSYVARGRYAEQLDRWVALFSPSQMLILSFADLVSQPLSVYRTTLEFIGVDPEVSPPPTFDTQNAGSRKPTRPETVEWLNERFAAPNADLAERYGVVF